MRLFLSYPPGKDSVEALELQSKQQVRGSDRIAWRQASAKLQNSMETNKNKSGGIMTTHDVRSIRTLA